MPVSSCELEAGSSASRVDGEGHTRRSPTVGSEGRGQQGFQPECPYAALRGGGVLYSLGRPKGRGETAVDTAWHGKARHFTVLRRTTVYGGATGKAVYKAGEHSDARSKRVWRAQVRQ
jgi:hypothetical protein